MPLDEESPTESNYPFPEVEKIEQLFEWLQLNSPGKKIPLDECTPAQHFMKILHQLRLENQAKADKLFSHIDDVYEMVKELEDMKQLDFFQRLSKGDLTAWWDVVGQNSHDVFSELSPEALLSETANKWADRGMLVAYVGLNILTVALAGLSCANVTDLGKLSFMVGETAGTAIASSWNYIDVIGGVVQGWHEIKLGNYFRGTAAFVSSSQLAASTMTANIGARLAPHIFGATAFVGLTGFSFAACMYIAMMTDLVSILRINRRIKTLEGKQLSVGIALKAKKIEQGSKKIEVDELSRDLDEFRSKKAKLKELEKNYAEFKRTTLKEVDSVSDQEIRSKYYDFERDYIKNIEECKGIIQKFEERNGSQEKAEVTLEECNTALKSIDKEVNKLKKKYTLYDKTIAHEKAKKTDLWRSAKSWGACAIGMTAVAVVAFIVANGATVGAASGLAIGVAVVAVLSSYVRARWVKHIKHEDNLKLAYSKEFNLQEKIERLDFDELKKALGIEFEKEIKISRYSLLSISVFSDKKSMKQYLQEMMHQDPEKAKKLIEALQVPDEKTFIQVLKEKRDTYDHRLHGRTFGEKLYRALEEEGKKEDKPYDIGPTMD